MSQDSNDGELSRRTFMRATGAVTGAGLLGLSAETVAAEDGFEPAYANWRTREASKVWEEKPWRPGYRGRPDRSLALTDTGVDARHPDVGPWNGIQALIRDDDLELTKPKQNDVERIDTGYGEQFSGTIGPGTFVQGTATRSVHEFDVPGDDDIEQIDVEMTWTPDNQSTGVISAGEDLELYLERKTADGWERVASSTRGSQPERITHTFASGAGPDADSTKEYRFVVETWANGYAEYDIDATYYELGGNITFVDDGEVFDFSGGGPQDKVVGWFDAGSGYGSYDKPRDPNGHGTHCSGIMAGSGRASAIESADVEEPRTILTAGDYVEYTVEAEAGTGVFATAYGRALDVLIYDPDGEQIASATLYGQGDHGYDSSTLDSSIAEAPAEQTGEYTVVVRPAEGEVASTGRLERVSYGSFADPQDTDGDRAGDGIESLHGGLSPDASIVGLQGLGGPTAVLADHAEAFASTFNVRSVNMSWGALGGAPFGAFGGALGSTVNDVKNIAEGGMLTCAAAGNSFTPANGNSSPAVADEAISVVATGPLDGISTYSSGGVGAVDEDENAAYTKPDVTAPGGRAPAYPASLAAPVYDDVFAAKAGKADVPEDEQGPIREYAGKLGTSMASPYVNGVAGLVAQAMEDAATPADVRLPEPADTGFDDVMRLKQTILATASETAFTAAPYHTAKTVPSTPTYNFGGRDPYEGYGRVNPDAAVDALTRDLPTDGSTVEETVGLDVPDHSRAVAGHVDDGPGVYEVSVDVSHLSGGNKGMAKGDPHVDLFVYDAENPAENGEPNVVAKAAGVQGSASLSFTANQRADDGSFESGTYFVVAKLVNVPGAVNGYDVQVHLDLSVEAVEDFVAVGSRTGSSDAYTSGDTGSVTIEVSASEPVIVRDRVPNEWEPLAGDYAREETVEGPQNYVLLDEDGADSPEEAAEHSFEYFFRVAESTGTYESGPVQVSKDGGETWIDVAGTTDTNVVVGAHDESPV